MRSSHGVEGSLPARTQAEPEEGFSRRSRLLGENSQKRQSQIQKRGIPRLHRVLRFADDNFAQDDKV